MFGSSTNGANAYAKVGLETGVSSANPHQLIVMLFDGALIAIMTAQQHMKSGNIAAKGQAISKAISIIDSGLRASLNKESGGEIGKNLDALYEYMSHRLLLANINNQQSHLEEVLTLLTELKGAWQTIGISESAVPEEASPEQSAAIPSKGSAYHDALEPHTPRLMKA